MRADRRIVPSYESGTSLTPLLGDTIGANLRRTIDGVPGQEAVIDVSSGRRWTYAEFGDDVDALATGLLASGLAVGDRVGIWAPNCPEWTLLQYATAAVGAILVTINPAYRTHELEFVLRQAGVTLLVSAPQFKGSDYEAMVAEVRSRCGALERVIFIGSAQWSELAGAKPDPVRLDEVAMPLSADQPINIQYTSGTTGFPKGATLSHHNILNNGFFVGELCRYTEEDRVCIPVPFYHCFGMTMGNLGCTTHGATMVIPAPGFDPGGDPGRGGPGALHLALWRAHDVHRRTQPIRTSSPTTCPACAPGSWPAHPVPVEVMKQVVDRMGMDGSHHLLRHDRDLPGLHPDPGDRLAGAAGRHGRAGASARRGQDRRPRDRPHRAPGRAGELCTRGYSVMLGYWDQAEQTTEAIDSARWMHTGDLGVMDDEGYVTITGRIKDMVIRGGENVYPREIEEFLYSHPDILDAQVIGVPDAKYGEELMVWIKLRQGAEPISAESLRAFCRGRLAHYKIPRYVHLVDEFPMTVTGKVRKVEMRELSVTLLGLGDARTLGERGSVSEG